MANLIITPEAKSDILRFYNFYLETANEKVAFAMFDTNNNKINELSKNPYLGRTYYNEEIGLKYREFLIFFGKARNCYIALYNFDGETVTVLRIKNARESGYRPIPIS